MLQKLLPMQAKAGPSIWQSSRKGKLSSVRAVITAPISPLQSQHTQVPSRHTTSRTSPTKDAPLLMKHLLLSAPECTLHSSQPHHCGFCSITELGQGNLGWRMYKFSMESASLQALSAASPHVLCLGYFVGGCCLLFPISPAFVLLYIIRIKATTSVQLGASEITNPYFFLLILVRSLIGYTPMRVYIPFPFFQSIHHCFKSSDKDFSILSPLCPKTRVPVFRSGFYQVTSTMQFLTGGRNINLTEEQSLLCWHA